MSIRVLIIDDHGVLRAGLASLLSAESGLEVVGEAADGGEGLRAAAMLRPDVIFMDISLPDTSGINLTRRVLEVSPESKVLVLTVHEDKSLLQEAVRAGAAGYILKRAVKNQLIEAIQTVQRGDLYVDPSMTRMLFTQGPAEQLDEATDELLTPRETDVLRLIAQGYTNKQAAELLNISVRTVEFHRANIIGKLGIRSRVELARYAESQDLL